MKTYREHYYKCQEAYEPNQAEQPNTKLYALALALNYLERTDEYNKLVKAFSEKVVQKLEGSKEECVLQMQNCIRIISFKEIPEIIPLIEYVTSQLEEKVFFSNVKVEHAHVYRNLPNTNPETSWLWHYDNCPNEFVKLAIYLNDVTDDDAPMQVMMNEQSQCARFPTSALRLKGARKKKFANGKSSRIPEPYMQQMKEAGYRKTKITGPAGTNFLFNPNLAHKATIPTEGHHRDAVFFFIRPSLTKVQHTTESLEYDPEVDVKVYKYD